MELTAGEGVLLRWLEELSGGRSAVDRLAALLTARAPDLPQADDGSHRSTLNNDGSPLQGCVTASREPGRAVRLIVDPADGVAAGSSKRAISDTLKRVLPTAGASELGDVVHGAMDAMLPDAPEGDSLRGGLCWVAAGVDGGAAVYVNTRWGRAADRWNAAGKWLATVLPEDRSAATAVAALRADCDLVSVAVEGRTLADARAKCYWRLARPIAMRAMGHPLFGSAPFTRFLEALGAERRLPLSALVWSTSFALKDGALRDGKVDVCGHCVERSGPAWANAIEQTCEEQGTASTGLGPGLEERRGEVAFFGLGVTRDGAARVNVYVKAAPCH